jgi:hypothetical protein
MDPRFREDDGFEGGEGNTALHFTGETKELAAIRRCEDQAAPGPRHPPMFRNGSNAKSIKLCQRNALEITSV